MATDRLQSPDRCHIQYSTVFSHSIQHSTAAVLYEYLKFKLLYLFVNCSTIMFSLQQEQQQSTSPLWILWSRASTYSYDCTVGTRIWRRKNYKRPNLWRLLPKVPMYYTVLLVSGNNIEKLLKLTAAESNRLLFNSMYRIKSAERMSCYYSINSIGY